jgi:predicted NBD/HSP70 family sugar kinase
MKAYLGIDIGSISTKGVVLDESSHILASEYLWTQADPIGASRRVLNSLREQLSGRDVRVAAVGTTGSRPGGSGGRRDDRRGGRQERDHRARGGHDERLSGRAHDIRDRRSGL